MNEPVPMGFPDVPALLERSQPRGFHVRGLYALGIFLLIVLASAFVSIQGPTAAIIVQVLSVLAMIGVMAGLFVYSWFVARQHRAEQVQLEAIEELVTLRRWPQAAMVLEAMLSQPTRTPQARVQALIYLAGVLARYHRFDDTIAVQNYLLENVKMDDGTTHGLRLGRAMAMLREDHLFDADRAIADLRRRVGRDWEGEAPAEPFSRDSAQQELRPPNPESAGLALI